MGKYKKTAPLPIGHPAAKRDAFVRLTTLLTKLKASKYLCVPAVSNPYNLFDLTELGPLLKQFQKRRK